MDQLRLPRLELLVRCVGHFIDAFLDGIFGIALELLGVTLCFLSSAFVPAIHRAVSRNSSCEELKPGGAVSSALKPWRKSR